MHKAEMANIAQSEAECYINIEAEYWVLYFAYDNVVGQCYKEFP